MQQNARVLFLRKIHMVDLYNFYLISIHHTDLSARIMLSICMHAMAIHQYLGYNKAET